MANRHERRKAEKLARTQFSKEQLAANWRQAQAEAMQLKQMYRDSIVEIESLRQRALQTQMALVATLAATGDVEISDELWEAVQMGEYDGWASKESDGGITLHVTVAEVEDDTE